MYTTINGNKAKTLVGKGAKLIDIRSPVEFATNTIPSAINVPFRNVTTLAVKFDKKTPIICFGNEGQQDSAQFASYATQLGFTNVYVLSSINSWNEIKK